MTILTTSETELFGEYTHRQVHMVGLDGQGQDGPSFLLALGANETLALVGDLRDEQ